MAENKNLQMFKSLHRFFTENEGMSLDIARFEEYLAYTFETGNNVSYEEYLGMRAGINWNDVIKHAPAVAGIVKDLRNITKVFGG